MCKNMSEKLTDVLSSMHQLVEVYPELSHYVGSAWIGLANPCRLS